MKTKFFVKNRSLLNRNLSNGMKNNKKCSFSFSLRMSICVFANLHLWTKTLNIFKIFHFWIKLLLSSFLVIFIKFHHILMQICFDNKVKTKKFKQVIYFSLFAYLRKESISIKRYSDDRIIYKMEYSSILKYILSKPKSVNGHWFAVTSHWWEQP